MTAPTQVRPLPTGPVQWKRLLKGRALDLAMQAPPALQPRRLRRRMHWSVRVAQAASPWHARAAVTTSTVALSRGDVTDVHAAFVADPFLWRHDDRWHLFVEVQDRLRMRGCIGVAISTDAVAWRWHGVVLREPFHLSYPHVFSHDGDLWMIPETHEAGAVRLYRGSSPTRWRYDRDLLTGPSLKDATPLLHGGHWYLFVETSPTLAHDELRLFSARDLRGPWSEHPRSPIVVSNPALARPAGRLWRVDGRLFRLAQDCTTEYGTAVVAREIRTLTPDDYLEADTTTPLLGGGGTGWRRNGMHHLDIHPAPGGWLIAADGW